jgi:hypothetical protein
MAYLPSISIDTIFQQMGDFITLTIGCPVIVAQENRVPMPRTGFISMNDAVLTRLSTNITTFTDTHVAGSVQGSSNSSADMMFSIQLDAYGPLAPDWMTSIATLFRSEFGVQQFTLGIQPLYCSDSRQIQFINGETEFETRYSMDVFFQYNPITQTPMNFADTLSFRKPTSSGLNPLQ